MAGDVGHNPLIWVSLFAILLAGGFALLTRALLRFLRTRTTCPRDMRHVLRKW